jgi:hypothetical protein
MNLSLQDLKQAVAIRRQIDVLEKRLAAILRGSPAKAKAPRAGPKGGLTAAGRRKLSQLMKARWAVRRKGIRR